MSASIISLAERRAKNEARKAASDDQARTLTFNLLAQINANLGGNLPRRFHVTRVTRAIPKEPRPPKPGTSS